MNNSNPFAPTRTPAAAAVSAANQKTGSRGFEIFHNTFRGLLAFLFLGFTPVFVVPQFKSLFEEFGMELPTMAQLVFQFVDLACIAPIVFLPLSFALFVGIECSIFLFPSGKSKTLINVIYWLALVLVFGSACITVACCYSALISDLAATTERSSHLFRV